MGKITFTSRATWEKMTLDVNPCPLCGLDMEVYQQDVKCPICHIGTVGFGFLSTAIDNWNRSTDQLNRGIGRTFYKCNKEGIPVEVTKFDYFRYFPKKEYKDAE